MNEKHPDQGHRRFWSMMKELTWKERVTNFLYYYGKFAILGIFLIYMAISVMVDAFVPKPEKILAGTAINVHVSVDMEKKLTDGAFAAVGGTDTKKQEVTLVPNTVSQANLHQISALQTKLLAGDFDYVLMDQTALDMLISMQALPELDRVLTAERLAQWEGKYIYIETDGRKFPVAIDITGTALAAGCDYDSERIFLAFPVNLDTLDVVEPFFAYLTDSGLLKAP